MKLCPPVTVAALEFHSKIPHSVFPVSNQYVPSAGLAAGAVADASNSVVFKSARVTKALLLTPK